MTTETASPVRSSEHILAAFVGTYWAIAPEKLAAMCDFFVQRAEGVRFSAAEIAARAGSRQRAVQPAGQGIAVLPLFGLVSHRAHMVQNISGPGGTSTELFGRDLEAALADSDVGTILLDVDSPGGSVNGVIELADRIFEARGEKRIIAIANSLAASAAYWIASAADELVVTNSGEVGSVGVYAIHADKSRENANKGVTYTIIKAGPFKAEGNPYEPLSSEAQAYLKSQVDEYYDLFIESVARNRGVATAVVREQFGQGRTVNARGALTRRMADRIATYDQVLAGLGASPMASAKPTRDKRGARELAVPSVIGPAAHADPGAAALVPNGIGVVLPTAIVDMRDMSQLLADLEQTSDVVRLFRPIADEAASAARHPSLEQPAPKAEEIPVSTQTTAAPENGASPTAAAQAAAQSVTELAFARQESIRQLCSLAGASMEQYSTFVASGKTADQVRAELAAGLPTPQPAQVRVGADREAERGFASFGEQLFAVVQAGRGRVDKRLLAINAAASGMNESVGSEGGFFIQNDLLPGVLDPVYEDDPILSRVNRIPIGDGKNGVKFNVVDETDRATGSRWGGIQMYWQAEGGAATPTKAKTRRQELNLKKLIGAAYLTEELQEDSTAAAPLLTRAFQAEVRFMLGDGITRGTGGGQPLGYQNGPAFVKQAIEATQTIANTNTFIALNASKMLSRLPASLWSDAIWLYNQELLPYIITATIGANGAIPIFMTQGGLANKPYDTILGRPAFASELCDAVGTPGDLVLIAPSQIDLIDKGGPKQATSVHVRFLNDEDTLKITYRVDAQPRWSKAVTPYKGALTRSAYIGLDTRA